MHRGHAFILGPVHGDHHGIAEGGDTCRPRLAGEEPQLSDHAARFDEADNGGADSGREMARENEEHLVRGAALLKQHRAARHNLDPAAGFGWQGGDDVEKAGQGRFDPPEQKVGFIWTIGAAFVKPLRHAG